MHIETKPQPPNCASFALEYFGYCKGDLFVVPPSPTALSEDFNAVSSLDKAQLVVFVVVRGLEVVTYHMIVCHEDDPTHGSQRAISGADVEPDVYIPDKISYLQQINHPTRVLYFRKKPNVDNT
ncbi:MAG: hypothetical protein Q8L37_00035 [Candidatus Gottesmanbacteria bacterium]|nr:hypothetical protein [Candidatus Gottesmanbacteria bacterium]